MSLTDLPTSAPARKVVAAAGGAGLGAVTYGLVDWLLDDYVFDPTTPNSVPVRLAAFLLVVIPSVVAYAGGYFTRRGVDELAPPQRPGQHVRRQDETGGAALPPEPPMALVLAVVVVIVVLAVVLLDGALRT